jgi:hypothetical protein
MKASAGGGRPPAAGVRGEDGRTPTGIEVLQREGLRFTGDVADPTQRLTIAELRALLATDHALFAEGIASPLTAGPQWPEWQSR